MLAARPEIHYGFLACIFSAGKRIDRQSDLISICDRVAENDSGRPFQDGRCIIQNGLFD